MEEYNRQVVTDVSEIKANIAAFNIGIRENYDEALSLARMTTYWVFDPESHTFGPSKFLGFKGMNFERYLGSKQDKLEGAVFTGGVRNDIEKLLGNEYKNNYELSDKLRQWGENYFEANWFQDISQEKWRFLVLPSASYITDEVIQKLLALLRQTYPNWQSFADPDFVKDELEYKQACSHKIQELLPEGTIRQLLEDHNYNEIIQRLEKAGQSSNLLYLASPRTADLSVLYADNLNKEGFCKSIVHLLYGKENVEQRLKAYCDFLETNKLPNKWAFPTFVLYMLFPAQYMFVKPTPTTWFLKCVGLPLKMRGKPDPSDYQMFNSLALDLFQKLSSYGPKNLIDVQSLIWVSYQASKPATPNYWWVNQGSSYTEERQKEIVWSPYKNESGKQYYHWDNVSKIKQGDVILHYSQGSLRSVSRALSDPENAPNPHKGAGAEWSKKGRQLNLDYQDLNPIVNLEQIQAIDEITEILKGPFDKNKEVKQGYLFNFSKKAYSALQSALPHVNWPDFDRDTIVNEENIMENQTPQHRHLNTILYGPPGTGKTYAVYERVVKLADPNYSTTDRANLMQRYKQLRDAGQIQFVTFHQSYSYEEFIEGIRPCLGEEGETKYELRDGVLKQIARLASAEFTQVETETHIEFDAISFFKMSLGEAAKPEDEPIYDYCIQNGCVALGWGEEYDFSSVLQEHTYDKQREKISIIYENPKSEKSLSMVHTFLRMPIGSIVFVSNGNRSIRAIGVVNGNYKCDPENEIGFSQLRPVNWLLTNVDIPVEKVYARNFSQQSLYELSKGQLNIDALKEILTGQKKSRAMLNYVLIIDEINRGNISKVFGEAITLLDHDKRSDALNSTSTMLPYSQKPFSLPSNLFIIGTMNTADRSIALMDVALRRRFHFEELMPQSSVIREVLSSNKVSSDLLDTVIAVFDVLNRRIEVLLDRDHQIGHSYFLDIYDETSLRQMWYEKIIPLVQEYFYNDWDRLKLLLGTNSLGGFVQDVSDNKAYQKLFADGDSQDIPGQLIVYKENEAFMQALKKSFLAYA